MFLNDSMGALVPISGTDPQSGAWRHAAFVPTPLPLEPPNLSPTTYLAVANARAALAALDSTARQLPNPTLLRRSTLQREAQSTSALEGTYAPLSEVLTADDDPPPLTNMREIINYINMANQAFSGIDEGRPVNPAFLCELQETLVRGTKDEGPQTGRIRSSQVVVGRRADVPMDELPVRAARFVPSPPGPELEANVRDLTDWFREPRSQTLDPVIASALAHYQFETLHPFHDGNGRIGRLLIVAQFYLHGVLSEPTLTVSPWFEARRTEYYDRLLSVSASGAWDSYVHFFATGIRESAELTHRQMVNLVNVQSTLKETVRASRLRADTAHSLVDFAVANPSFTVRGVQRGLSISYGRANRLVAQLEELNVLRELALGTVERRFFAPEVMRVLTEL